MTHRFEDDTDGSVLVFCPDLEQHMFWAVLGWLNLYLSGRRQTGGNGE